MSIRKVIEILNSIPREKFRQVMQKAILSEFFEVMIKKGVPCKVSSQKHLN